MTSALAGVPALLLLAATSTPGMPPGPEELRCPDGTARHRTESRGRIVARCRRPDGVLIGPQASWYLDGSPAELRIYVARGEGSVAHGVEIQWQPDGTVFLERRLVHGELNGEERVDPLDGPLFTRLHERDILLDVYEGRMRPDFGCPPLRRHRVRLGDDGFGRELRPTVEHWCEDPDEPARFPAQGQPIAPTRWRCLVTGEGIQAWTEGGKERLPLPASFDAEAADAVNALCRSADFWRRGRREGPYVSRGRRGELLEEGEFVGGRRHGIWRVRGRACVEWSRGQRLGRAPCADGAAPAADPWLASHAEEIAGLTERLAWPPLEATVDGEREVRIWRFPERHGVTYGSSRVPRVLRLHGPATSPAGEVASWQAPPELHGACHAGDGAEVCRFERLAASWSWAVVEHELGLLDVWTLPPASSIRLPAVGRQPGDERAGFFVEVRSEAGVRREWFGPIRDEPFAGTHQTRGIAALVDRVWGAVAEEPPPREPLAEPAGCDPWVEIGVSPERVSVGGPVTLRLRARARAGLGEVWWFATREDRPGVTVASGRFSGGGSRETEHESVERFDSPGRLVLGANARDRRLGLHLGQPHQASEGCGLGRAELEVVP